MACKDCIHYDICLIRDELSDGESKVVSVLECENFKDRARFVELPCKVGDSVFTIDNKENIQECTVINVNCKTQLTLDKNFGLILL